MCGLSSRESRPKQFISLIGEKSTFQSIVGVLGDREIFAEPIVITNNSTIVFSSPSNWRRSARRATIVLEPMRRDSGPAVAVAASLAAAIR